MRGRDYDTMIIDLIIRIKAAVLMPHSIPSVAQSYDLAYSGAGSSRPFKASRQFGDELVRHRVLNQIGMYADHFEE
jgi:hypothetical protein